MIDTQQWYQSRVPLKTVGYLVLSGYNLQPFDGKTDFSIWQQKMKGILIQQKVFKAIDGKYADNVSDDKKLENDEYAYFSFILNLSDSLIQDIKLTGDKNIDDYSPIVLLNAIPETYRDVKAAIKYGRDNVNLEIVVSGLKSKEMDLKTNKPSQNQNEVNFVRGRTKNRNSDYKYRRHSKSRSRSKGRSQSRSKYRNNRHNNNTDKNSDEKQKEKRCYNCGGRGHFIKECKKPRKNESKDTANVAEESSDEVYMLCDVNSAKSSLSMNELLLDSGFSMTNEKLCDVKGFGDVCLTFESGFKLTLQNVRHVPDLCHNLISCAALEEEGPEGR
ncbi:UNVERIFIED_CONTAM: hypothetical protein Sangu_0210300 [Sesamum angustifolium]|uniref:CCHC-type domain-containing protein n=1 Tax=Sesamum angustifolium TaxID=2727405 RepID=A0AAW2RN28_9LAMI